MVTSARLSDQERALVDLCLKIVGDFIDDDEFHTLIGKFPHEIAELIPVGEVITEDTLSGAQAVIVNLLGYPHGRNQALDALVDRASLEKLLTKLIGLPGLTRGW